LLDRAPQVEVALVLGLQPQDFLGLFGVVPEIGPRDALVPLFDGDFFVREVKDTSIARRAVRGT
jgi:hypothetical protein